MSFSKLHWPILGNYTGLQSTAVVNFLWSDGDGPLGIIKVVMCTSFQRFLYGLHMIY